MIENAPGIYNAPSVYNQGGGGGGEPQPDKNLYQTAIGLKLRSTGGTDLSGTNFLVKEDDKIDAKVYFFSSGVYGTLNLFHTNGRLCWLQSNGPTSLRVYGFGSSEFLTKNNPDYFDVFCQGKAFKINGTNKNIGSVVTGSFSIDDFFSTSNSEIVGSIFFELRIMDSSDVEKFHFIPCKRLQDSKIGILELYTDTFLQVPQDWELVGIS